MNLAKTEGKSGMNKWMKLGLIAAGTVLLAGAAVADPSVQAATDGFAKISTNVQSQSHAVYTLIKVIAYVAGFAMMLMGIMKLKHHKDNPAQVQLSNAFVLLGVAALLMFAGFFIVPLGQSIFGQQSGGQSSNSAYSAPWSNSQ